MCSLSRLAVLKPALGAPIVLKQSESDEIEARDQLRAKLRREQLKNAALASLKAKIKANQLTSTVPGLTMLSKSIRASNAKAEGNGVCQRPDRVTSTVPASSSLLSSRLGVDCPSLSSVPSGCVLRYVCARMLLFQYSVGRSCQCMHVAVAVCP